MWLLRDLERDRLYVDLELVYSDGFLLRDRLTLLLYCVRILSSAVVAESTLSNPIRAANKKK